MTAKKSSIKKDKKNQVNDQVNEEVNSEVKEAVKEEVTEEVTEEAKPSADGTAEAETQAEDADPMAELQKAFDDLTKAKAEADSQMLRLQADFDNFRKRTRAEKEEWRAMIVSGFCTDILPVMDNFRWAVMAMEKDEAAKPHLAGVQMILKQLTDVLAGKGVEQIKTIGEEFDPKYHDAMGQVEVDDESQNNKVLEEITAGYKIGEKVIRAARVKVGAFKDKSENTEE